MNKVTPKRRRAVKTPATQTVVPGKHLKLPPQEPGDVQLVETDTVLLKELAAPNDFREALSNLKKNFVKDLEALAGVCDLKAEAKIYFTFKHRE